MAETKITTKEILPASNSIFIIGGIGLASPADATNYFNAGYGFSASTSSGLGRMYMPFAGTITACYINSSAFGTVGTSETSTFSIRLNNTTDTTVSSAVVLSTGTTAYNSTALSIAVAAGDYIEYKLLTPTWVTNPGSITLTATVRLDRS